MHPMFGFSDMGYLTPQRAEHPGSREAAFAYLGGNGDVLAMTDAVMGTWSYTYDDFNRLTGGTATAGVDSGLALGWTYDRYGNRWAQNATGSGNATAVQPQLSFTGNNNHVDGWSYDAAGNLLERRPQQLQPTTPRGASSRSTASRCISTTPRAAEWPSIPARPSRPATCSISTATR